MTLRDEMLNAITKRGMILSEMAKYERRDEELANERLSLDEAGAIIQKAAVMTQDGLKDRFESIVQSCLDAVFPNDYRFHMDFVARRGATEVDVSLEPLTGVKKDKEGNVQTRIDPAESNGGGIMDIISLGLRLACLTLSSNRRVLIMDEPFKMIRQEPRKRLGEVVTAMARKLGIQVVMVADVDGTGIVPDRVFRVAKGADGRSHVRTCEPEASIA